MKPKYSPSDIFIIYNYLTKAKNNEKNKDDQRPVEV